MSLNNKALVVLNRIVFFSGESPITIIQCHKFIFHLLESATSLHIGCIIRAMNAALES